MKGRNRGGGSGQDKKHGGKVEKARMKYGWGESGMGVVEVASNAKAISQSTSDGPNRHTKRVGVIFKTEDGTPAGILNNRRGWAKGRVAAEGIRPRKRNRNVVEEYSSERPRREEWQAGKLGNWTWTLLSNANATRDTEASLALPRFDSQCTRTGISLASPLSRSLASRLFVGSIKRYFRKFFVLPITSRNNQRREVSFLSCMVSWIYLNILFDQPVSLWPRICPNVLIFYNDVWNWDSTVVERVELDMDYLSSLG